MIFLGVGPQPANGALAIFDLSREGVLRLATLVGLRESILDCDGHVSTLGRFLNVISIGDSSTAAPTAAMNVDNSRQQSCRMLRPRQVEFEVFVPALPVDDVLLENDTVDRLG